MKINRSALIRFIAIDEALRDEHKNYSLEDLISLCSDKIKKIEGPDKGVSKRTTQLDLQYMRSSELGFNAPIVVKDRKYYAYSDPDYKLTDIPIADQDQTLLMETIKVLEQYQAFKGSSKISLAHKILSASDDHDPVVTDIKLPKTSKSKKNKKKVVFSCSKKVANKIQKSPIHPSQIRESKSSKSSVFSIEVPLTPVIENTLLNYGADIVIKKPKKLKQKMENFYAQAYIAYKKK